MKTGIQLYEDRVRLILMRRLLSLTTLLLVAFTAMPLPAADLRAELEAMFESDQSYRLLMQDVMVKKGPKALELVELQEKQLPIDEANIKRLGQIVETTGWPRRSQVGDKGSMAAFLVVQHADLSTQEYYLPLLKAAVEEGEARPQDLALLEDRVLMRQGKRQRYGSQLQENSNGGFEFYPIEDEVNVDERRKSVELPPLSEYANQFGIEYKPRVVVETADTPADPR